MKTEHWERLVSLSLVNKVTVDALGKALDGFPIEQGELEPLLHAIKLAVVKSYRMQQSENKTSKKKILSVAAKLGSSVKVIGQLDGASVQWINRAARSRGGSPRLSGGIAPSIYPDEDRFAALLIELT